MFRIGKKTDDEIQTQKRHRKSVKKTSNSVAVEHKDEFALIERLKEKTHDFIKTCRCRNLLLTPTSDHTHLTNEQLKAFLDEWQSDKSSATSSDSFTGGNNASESIVIERHGTKYIIPGDCNFFSANVTDMEHIELAKEFDLIVMDPPWWNKYVRRSRKFINGNGYEMLTNEAIADIPIEKMVQKDKTLVIIWCTNAPSMIEAVKGMFLRKWRLKLLATWFWIKVTKNGETICDFGLPLKKQPFERIFIATHVDSTHEFNIPDEKLIFSIPSAIHLHKPPLQGTQVQSTNQFN